VECTRNKEYQANVLLPNGDVMLCCMDYSLKHNLGNLLTSSYDEVINGNEVKKVAALNKKIGYSDEVLCRSCNDGFCHTPWNNKEVYEIVKQLDPDSLGL
jgi:radical SAM protein with 4Fe4S-binding SPASM domain